MRAKDLCSAFFAIAFGGWIIFTTFANNTISVSSHIGGGIDAAGYPRLLGTVAVVVGILMVLSAWWTNAQQTIRSAGRPLHSALALAIIVLYLAALPWLGFFVVTPLLALGLMIAFGERRPVAVALSAGVITVVFFVSFRYGADILLPHGRLFATDL